MVELEQRGQGLLPGVAGLLVVPRVMVGTPELDQRGRPVVEVAEVRVEFDGALVTGDGLLVVAEMSIVARNIAVDRLRAKSARPHEVDQCHTDTAAVSIPDHAEATVTSVYVARAVATLPPGSAPCCVRCTSPTGPAQKQPKSWASP